MQDKVSSINSLLPRHYSGLASVFFYGALVIALLYFLALQLLSFTHGHGRDFRFVRDLLLTEEVGGYSVEITRWTGDITVSIAVDRRGVSSDVRDVLEQISPLIAPLGINLIDEGEGDIKLYVPDSNWVKKELSPVGGRNLRRYSGYFDLTQADDGSISKGRIIVNPDVPKPDIKKVLVHEFAHALGLTAHSKIFPDSVLYQNRPRFLLADELAPVDRKLIRFLYRYLEPGDDEELVREIFDLYWYSISSE